MKQELNGCIEHEELEYKGVSRIVVKKFRVYFEWQEDEVIVIAILFPGGK